jgi:hypothetical protein
VVQRYHNADQRTVRELLFFQSLRFHFLCADAVPSEPLIVMERVNRRGYDFPPQTADAIFSDIRYCPSDIPDIDLAKQTEQFTYFSHSQVPFYG